MRGRDFEKLSLTYLLDKLPGFQVRRGLIFATPLTYYIRGYFFDPSGWGRSDFYVNVFVQPLFVPKDGIVLSVGERLGAGWTIPESNEAAVMEDIAKHMLRDGRRLLDKFKTLRDIADRVVAHHKNKHDLYVPEMAAYAAILLDDSKTAAKMFDCAERRFHMDDDRRDWVVALMDRIRMMRRTFEENSSEAKSILHRWRDETAANLKLTEFIDDSAPA